MKSFKSLMESLAEAWPGTPEYKKKFGAASADGPDGSRHKIDRSAGITRATRKYDTESGESEEPTKSREDAAAAPAKRGRGRPAGKYGSYKKKIKESIEILEALDTEEEIEEFVFSLDEESFAELEQYLSEEQIDEAATPVKTTPGISVKKEKGHTRAITTHHVVDGQHYKVTSQHDGDDGLYHDIHKVSGKKETRVHGSYTYGVGGYDSPPKAHREGSLDKKVASSLYSAHNKERKKKVHGDEGKHPHELHDDDDFDESFMVGQEYEKQIDEEASNPSLKDLWKEHGNARYMHHYYDNGEDGRGRYNKTAIKAEEKRLKNIEDAVTKHHGPEVTAAMKKHSNAMLTTWQGDYKDPHGKKKATELRKQHGVRWNGDINEEVEAVDEALKGAMHPDAAKVLKHIKPEHHGTYKPYLKQGVYKGGYSDRAAVLSAAEKAGHVKEEVELDEADEYKGMRYGGAGIKIRSKKHYDQLVQADKDAAEKSRKDDKETGRSKPAMNTKKDFEKAHKDLESRKKEFQRKIDMGHYGESVESELDEKYMGAEKLASSLAAKGAKDPKALAAWIGRKKYGKEAFQKAAAKGEKMSEAEVDEALKHPKHAVLDKNKNNKLDKEDFQILRGEKKAPMKEEVSEDQVANIAAFITKQSKGEA